MDGEEVKKDAGADVNMPGDGSAPVQNPNPPKPPTPPMPEPPAETGPEAV